VTSKAYSKNELQDNPLLTSSTDALQDAPMNKDEKIKAYLSKIKPLRAVRIEKLMNKTMFKQAGLNKLSRQELANLNAFLNLPKNRQMLAPGPKPN
jgi:hypothetical protein